MAENLRKILIIDDELDILEVLGYYFSKKGFKVFTALDGKSGIEQAKRIRPEVIILDVMMPGLSGIEVVEKLRKNSNFSSTLICILSAKNEEKIEKRAFAAGADEYITKPIPPKVLLSRIMSLVNKNIKEKWKDIQDLGDIQIHHSKRIVKTSKEESKLSKGEYHLLKLLSNKPGRVYSQDEILINLFNSNSLKNAKELEVVMKKLRKKVGKKYLKTIKGIGFKFEF